MPDDSSSLPVTSGCHCGAIVGLTANAVTEKASEMRKRFVRNFIIGNLILWLLLAAYAVKQDRERRTPAEAAATRVMQAQWTPTPCPYANLTTRDMLTTPYEDLDRTRTC
jgi:hypothetical protein